MSTDSIVLNSTSDNIPMKPCSKCKQKFPATSEYFHKDKSRSDGLRSVCKSCAAQNSQQWEKANPDKRKAKGRRYYWNHSDERNAYGGQYYQDNVDKVKEHNFQYRQANSDKINKQKRQYQQANPDKIRAKEHRRRALKRGLLATFSDQEWIDAQEYFKHCCAYCGRGARLFDRSYTLHQDHVIPLVKRGPYTKFNIVPACQSCNLSKHDHDLDQWLISKWGKHKAGKKIKAIRDYFGQL